VAGDGIRPEDRWGLVRRNAIRLEGAQVALWGAIGVAAAFGTLSAHGVTHRQSAAAVFLGAFYVGSAAGARVAGRVMDRLGRRPGLAGGYVLLSASGLMEFAATGAGSFGWLLVGAVVLGSGAGAALLGRTALADMHPPEQRGRAVGRLVVMGTIGAVGGPPLGGAVHEVAEGLGVAAPLAVPWLLVTVLSLVSLVLVLGLRPDPRELAVEAGGTPAPARRPREVLRLRPALVAVVAIGVGQAVMVTFMSVLPVVVRGHGAAPLTVSLVVSVHLAGMFALSPVVGTVLDRWGRRSGLLAGVILSASGVALGLVSTATPVATGALFLIGVGWSAAYLGSTAVVSDLAAASERAGALGLSDLVAATAAAVGVLGGAALLEAAGYGALSIVALGLLILPAALLVPLRERTPGAWGEAVVRDGAGG
jgi:MFS family permease